ncbi:MAG: hypothetical protein LBC89_05155 [Bacteroidales bacterium]|nr:hypothetical protein [Bacteroidales bacterium]
MIEAGVASVRMTSAINLEYGSSPKYWYRYTLDVTTSLFEYPITKDFLYVRGTQLSF